MVFNALYCVKSHLKHWIYKILILKQPLALPNSTMFILLTI